MNNFTKEELQFHIDTKLALIANSLPDTVNAPASFACGYDVGYKQALLDIEEAFELGPVNN